MKRTYEDLKIWQESMVIIERTYQLCSSASQEFDWNLKNQMKKSAVSIASNIAEGFERETPKEFIRFLFFSKGSAGELLCQLQIANRLGFVSKSEFETMESQIIGLSKMIARLIQKVRP